MPDNLYRIPGGYQVRFERGWRPSRVFKADEFGGLDVARRAGEMWRDAMASLLQSPASGTEHLHTGEARRRSWEGNTRTGVPGIGYTVTELADGSESLFIQGYWDEGSRWGCTKRSVRKHGLQDALRQVSERVANERGDVTAEALFSAALPALQDVAAEIETASS